ncbi:MAG: hypothetical protein R6U28_12025 [Cyclonatronaceae bacterium]
MTDDPGSGVPRSDTPHFFRMATRKIPRNNLEGVRRVVREETESG